jgi:spermidine/putrescine transport system permease protein
MKNQNHSARIYTALIFIILYAPLAVLIVFSFNSANSTSVFGEFSVKWYGELFKDRETITSLKNTIILAVASSVISTVVGTAASVGIYKIRKRWVRLSIMTTTNIPMMNPDIVTGISMMLLFVFVGTLLGVKGVLGFKTLLIAHITFELPYIVLSVIPRLRQMDRYLTEAAEDLGCTPAKAFFKVTLPYIKPGILTGFIMAFTLSLDDFVISYFCSGPGFQTLPIRIYSMTKKRVTPDMYALSTIIFIVILILLLLSNTSKTRTAKVRGGNA